ncbi:MAG TPA: hypothetical protein VFZ53_34425 [Polyangiaceae bacterium]
MPAPRVLPWLMVLAGACGSPPPPRPTRPPPAAPVTAAREIDHCAPENGKPVEPLVRKYEGVAAAARCQREVYTIMGYVTVALGQPCEYCHVENDYPRMTHRKHVANWMAQKLVPSLEKRGGGDVWCKDCHAASGTGRAKLLGDPRSKPWAVEWMSTHLTEQFDTAAGDPLRCKLCHGGNLGSKEWDPKVILTEHLPPVTSHPPDAGAPPAPDLDAGVPDAAPNDGG